MLNTKIAAVCLLDSLPSEERGERIDVDVPWRKLSYEERVALSLTPAFQVLWVLTVSCQQRELRTAEMWWGLEAVLCEKRFTKK